MGIKLVTPPNTQPISLDEAKAFLRVDSDHEDALITSLIKAATSIAEKETGRVFITQTWDLWLNCFPVHRRVDQDSWWDGVREGPLTSLYRAQNHIEIPKPPLQSVTFLKTHNASNTEATFDSDNYIVDVESNPGRLALAFSQVWPAVVLRPANGVQVRFVAGYGEAEDVPEDIKTAIKLILMHVYENRGCEDAARAMIPSSAHAILQPYMVRRL